MAALTRRQFVSRSGSALAFAATGLGSGGAFAAMRPNDKFDLIIKGGELLDPSQNLRAKRDIGIRYGLIEALEADIPARTRPEELTNSSRSKAPPSWFRPATPGPTTLPRSAA